MKIRMSLNRADGAFNLLGQAAKPLVGTSLLGPGEPQLHVAWGAFHQGLAGSLAAIFSRAPRSGISSRTAFFKDSRIEHRIPRRAVIAAALWHVALLILPFPDVSTPRHNPALDNVQLTWSGSIEDLPLLDIRAAKPRSAMRPTENKQPPKKGADAFHPRQRIFTDPVHPTHPRQTLINSAAPPEAPKFLTPLPNIVQLQQSAAPARPRLQISEDVLKKLRPRERRAVATTTAPQPDLPNLEQRPAELSIAAAPNAPARPKLEINAGSVPRVAARSQSGDAGAAPDVGMSPSTVPNGNASTLIALSAAPAPLAATIQVPQGNLAARISISPDEKTPGAGGDSVSNGSGISGGGAGNNSVGVSISGGNPKPGSGVSGLGGSANISAPSPRILMTRPDPHYHPEALPDRTGPPNFSSLPPGAKPEVVLGAKRVYTLHVNMPNLNSATGSWILNFSELHANAAGPHLTATDISGPVPLKKIDPKYPPVLISDHVEGEVVLYAVIRNDGTVDGIQLVKGIDEQLDANAMHALSQWKFRPGTKQGTPVDLEAIVHIPFRAPIPQPQ